MRKLPLLTLLALSALSYTSCQETGKGNRNTTESTVKTNESFDYIAESFADVQVLRYNVPGWDELSLQQKEFIYYLSEASLAGRDIIWDQRGKYNLTIRKIIETIYETYSKKREGVFDDFKTYAAQVWFNNGIYHHYSNDKIIPSLDKEAFIDLIKSSDTTLLPLADGQTVDQLIAEIIPVIYDKNLYPKMKDTRKDVDKIANSSNNFYEGVTEAEVLEFYKKFPNSDREPEWGLNSKLVKENGQLVEKVWKVGGMYSPAIEKMIYWIEKAIPLAESENQKKALRLLIEYYQTGDLKKWDEYAIQWTKVTDTDIDFTSGFIEVYADAIGKKGSFESIVSLRDPESSKRIQAIAQQAQWFEDNSPLIEEHKKKNVKGIDAKVINVVMESGDAAPSTPIGINLPNSDWIRKEHGSKSVSLANIINAYNESAGAGMSDEFVINDEMRQLIKTYGNLASDLHTDMHECIGHASGQINPGIGTPDQTLKSYASTLEEARADLVALYYIRDKKLVDIGVMPSLDVGKAEYYSYIMNGMLTQNVRIKLGDNLEEDHMRNRALVANWAYEKGKKDNVIELVKINNKTYVQINDYDKLRELFGELLREIQRIKSEGDYNAGKDLVETYGVKIDPTIHKEILDRYATLNVKPYKGFIQPKLIPVMNGDKIVDIKIEYPQSFFDQMMEYGKKYAFLPVKN